MDGWYWWKKVARCRNRELLRSRLVMFGAPEEYKDRHLQLREQIPDLLSHNSNRRSPRPNIRGDGMGSDAGNALGSSSSFFNRKSLLGFLYHDLKHVYREGFGRGAPEIGRVPPRGEGILRSATSCSSYLKNTNRMPRHVSEFLPFFSIRIY